MSQIKKFQQENCLDPDGILGPITIRKMKEVFCIESNEHMAHFLGQVAHETANFKYSEENLNYSAQGLLSTFGKYFTPAQAQAYARQPVKIANRVYANRMGNGTEESGDGSKFKGRGALQTTGKNNYEALANKLRDLQIMNDPGLVATKYYFESALFFFNKNNLWPICDQVNEDSIKALTRRINGGYNGLQDRIDKTLKFYSYLKG